MTLFRHFASKEALLLEDPFDPVMANEARVAAAAVIAGLSRALLDWSRDEECDLHARVNRALDILGGGH